MTAQTTPHAPLPSIDTQKLEALLGRVVGDVGGAYCAALTVIGDQLGLFRALAQSSGLTPEELALATGTAPRYVREWLCAQAAGHYVTYSADSGTFSLTPEQAAAFADEASPAFAAG